MGITGKRSNIGLLIKMRRKELKISQERLGEMVGVSYQQIQKYESGKDMVSAERLREIASALNIGVSYFYENPIISEFREAILGYYNLKGLSPDENELIRCFRTIDDIEFRKRFMLLLMRAANRG